MAHRRRPTRPFRPLILGVGLVATLLILLGPVPGQAQSEDQGKSMISSDLSPEEINAVSHKLTGQFMSPFCPGKTLRDCTSGKAAELRDEIHGWVAEGKSREWIEGELVGRFGESILAAPKFKGFNALVWIFPFLAVLVGLGLVFSYLKRQHTVQLATSVPGVSTRDDYQADPELDAELERELADRQS